MILMGNLHTGGQSSLGHLSQLHRHGMYIEIRINRSGPTTLPREMSRNNHVIYDHYFSVIEYNV